MLPKRWWIEATILLMRLAGSLTWDWHDTRKYHPPHGTTVLGWWTTPPDFQVVTFFGPKDWYSSLVGNLTPPARWCYIRPPRNP